MALGDFSVRLDEINATINGNVVEVRGRFTRTVEDSDGQRATESMSASLAPMSRAAFGALTGADIRTNLISQLQSNHTKVTSVS